MSLNRTCSTSKQTICGSCAWYARKYGVTRACVCMPVRAHVPQSIRNIRAMLRKKLVNSDASAQKQYIIVFQPSRKKNNVALRLWPRKLNCGCSKMWVSSLRALVREKYSYQLRTTSKLPHHFEKDPHENRSVPVLNLLIFRGSTISRQIVSEPLMRNLISNSCSPGRRPASTRRVYSKAFFAESANMSIAFVLFSLGRTSNGQQWFTRYGRCSHRELGSFPSAEFRSFFFARRTHPCTIANI